MNKLVINTQYLENYGTPESPYMKFKGGYTYVMNNCGEIDQNQIATIVAQVKPYITTDLLQTNGSFEEYILDVSVIGQRLPSCEEWKSPTEFYIDGGVHFMKITDNRVDGWMRKEILEKTETWSNDRDCYKVSYLMEDGDICDSEDEIKDWFKAKEVA